MTGYIFGAYFKQFSLSFPDVDKNKRVAETSPLRWPRIDWNFGQAFRTMSYTHWCLDSSQVVLEHVLSHADSKKTGTPSWGSEHRLPSSSVTWDRNQDNSVQRIKARLNWARDLRKNDWRTLLNFYVLWTLLISVQFWRTNKLSYFTFTFMENCCRRSRRPRQLLVLKLNDNTLNSICIY